MREAAPHRGEVLAKIARKKAVRARSLSPSICQWGSMMRIWIDKLDTFGTEQTAEIDSWTETLVSEVVCAPVLVCEVLVGAFRLSVDWVLWSSVRLWVMAPPSCTAAAVYSNFIMMAATITDAMMKSQGVD